MKPIVDGLEKELGDKLLVIRLNIQDPVGRALTKPYNFQYTPTFIYFDAQGVELWRTIGSLNLDRVRDSVGP